MKLFGILAIVGLAEAEAEADPMSVFEARESVSNLAITSFYNLTNDVMNSNGKIIFYYFK